MGIADSTNQALNNGSKRGASKATFYCSLGNTTDYYKILQVVKLQQHHVVKREKKPQGRQEKLGGSELSRAVPLCSRRQDVGRDGGTSQRWPRPCDAMFSTLPLRQAQRAATLQ